MSAGDTFFKSLTYTIQTLVAGTISAQCDVRLTLSDAMFAGDNFFKSATYTIEALVVDKIAEVKDKVENIERILLDKRSDLKAFETVYREVSSVQTRLLLFAISA